MKIKKSKKSLLLALVFVLFLSLNSAVLANNALEEVDSTETEEDEPTEEEEAIEGAEAFLDLKTKIDAARENLSQSISDTSLLEARLSEVDDEIETLEDQIENIENQLEMTKKRIEAISENIRENEDAIDELKEEIDLLIEEIEKQKENLAELVVMIFFENEQAGFFDSSDLQTIKLLMGEDTVNEMLERSEGLTLLEFSLQDLLNELDANKQKLEEDKKELQAKTAELRLLREELKDEEIFLELQKTSKEKVLEQTRGEEEIYRELIRLAREEQIQIRRDINELVGAYAKYKDRFNRAGFAEDNFGTTFDSDKLSWPVATDLGISAYYRDAAYKAALGVEHNAIDIRAKQGSKLTAAADGVVMKVKSGEDTGYHYIIIGHNNGLMTLYGHVFDVYVQEGQNVSRGDLIGLTGGMPGTRGAGWLTTGPHLHLEVFVNGVHVDPMLYMDLNGIDEKFIPDSYLELGE